MFALFMQSVCELLHTWPRGGASQINTTNHAAVVPLPLAAAVCNLIPLSPRGDDRRLSIVMPLFRQASARGPFSRLWLPLPCFQKKLTSVLSVRSNKHDKLLPPPRLRGIPSPSRRTNSRQDRRSPAVPRSSSLKYTPQLSSPLACRARKCAIPWLPI
jgi:hypothetical protein